MISTGFGRLSAATVVKVGFTLLAAMCANSYAATYYVAVTGSDSANGSEATPWRTIRNAANKMVGGDTAIVKAGSYDEKVASVRSGSAGKRISFRASGKVVTKTFNIDHAYVTVDGFEMTAANDGYMMTLRGSYCEITNNVIHDTGASWGVVRMDSDSMTGCVIRGNKYYSSTGPGDDLTVFVVAGTNNLIENNEIGPAKDIDAFRAWGTNNTIRGNYIHDATVTSGSSAHMDVIQTFGLGGAISQNIVFERNLVVNFDGQICMTESNGSPGMHDWDVRNNIFVNVNLQANVGTPNFRFYNNTLYNVGSTNKLVMYLYDDPGKSNFSGARIMNNIFIASSNISNYGNVMSIGSSGSNVIVSNNFVASVSGFQPLSGWKENGGINGGDPKFVDAANRNFHLQAGSPAIDKGTTSISLATDYDGSPRPKGTAPDMGAYEFQNGGDVPSEPTALTVQ